MTDRPINLRAYQVRAALGGRLSQVRQNIDQIGDSHE